MGDLFDTVEDSRRVDEAVSYDLRLQSAVVFGSIERAVLSKIIKENNLGFAIMEARLR